MTTNTREVQEEKLPQHRPSFDAETASQSSLLECRICFSSYGSDRRRPKVLHCQHSCCSECLDQIWLKHQEILCPWCRCLTQLPQGFSVKHLPDDQEVLTAMSPACRPDDSRRSSVSFSVSRNAANASALEKGLASSSAKEKDRLQTPRPKNEMNSEFYCLCGTIATAGFIVIMLAEGIFEFVSLFYQRY